MVRPPGTHNSKYNIILLTAKNYPKKGAAESCNPVEVNDNVTVSVFIADSHWVKRVTER